MGVHRGEAVLWNMSLMLAELKRNAEVLSRTHFAFVLYPVIEDPKAEKVATTIEEW
jgi:hypothetical protein